MGRNSIPKLFEWRDGAIYRFRTVKDASFTFRHDSGEMIVYERETADGVETLATAWTDGLCELMAAMFEAGYARGKKEGGAKAQADIRQALGVKP